MGERVLPPTKTQSTAQRPPPHGESRMLLITSPRRPHNGEEPSMNDSNEGRAGALMVPLIQAEPLIELGVFV